MVLTASDREHRQIIGLDYAQKQDKTIRGIYFLLERPGCRRVYSLGIKYRNIKVLIR